MRDDKDYKSLYEQTLKQRIRFANKIDEQSELIKEMREEIGQLGLTYKGGGVETVCNNILEQTKDYA